MNKYGNYRGIKYISNKLHPLFWYRSRTLLYRTEYELVIANCFGVGHVFIPTQATANIIKMDSLIRLKYQRIVLYSEVSLLLTIISINIALNCVISIYYLSNASAKNLQLPGNIHICFIHGTGGKKIYIYVYILN